MDEGGKGGREGDNESEKWKSDLESCRCRAPEAFAALVMGRRGPQLGPGVGVELQEGACDQE